MKTTDEKVIELSRTKAVLLIAGACAAVAMGFWMFFIYSEEVESQSSFNNPIFIQGIGAFSILFFGLCGLSAVKKLLDKRPGLILSPTGITDNSSGVSAGFIPWSEIIGFDIFEFHKQKLLIVKVKNPEKYVFVGGIIKRALNKANSKLCGSPISITSNTLKIGFNELLEVCTAYFLAYATDA